MITPSPNCDCPVGETPPRLVAWKVSGKDSDLVKFQIELILASWRSKTNANYDSAWKAWEAWSAGKGIHPFEADVCNVLDFLAEKFDQGLKYRTLNCYRSALSSALLPIEGFQAGSHPLVSKLLKGIFNLRPPEPRYTDVWDVGQVLRYLQSIWAQTRV